MALCFWTRRTGGRVVSLVSLFLISSLLSGCLGQTAARKPSQRKARLTRSSQDLPHPSQPQPYPLGETPRIALLLPLKKGPYLGPAQTIREGFFAEFYEKKQQEGASPFIQIYDTGSGKGETLKEAYRKVLESGARYIVGPLTKS